MYVGLHSDRQSGTNNVYRYVKKQQNMKTTCSDRRTSDRGKEGEKMREKDTETYIRG